MSDTSEIPAGTIVLLDQEKKAAEAHRDKISRVTLEVEKLLLENHLNVGDLLEIFGLFTDRANKVFAGITIKEVKETYERST